MEKGSKPQGNRTVIPTNVSLYPTQRAALVALARREGHDVLARVVQELITRRATEVYGENWADVVTTDTDLKVA